LLPGVFERARKAHPEEVPMTIRRRGLGITGTLLSLFLLVSWTPGESKNPPITNFNTPRLVETDQLKALINHPLVRVVDMRTSLPDYLKSHLPNSVYLSFEHLRVPDSGIPAQLPDRICLERVLGNNLSVSNDMWAVLYSERSNPNATYLAWTLDFLDHRKIGILNGGWEKWVAEREPVTQEYPPLMPKKFFGKVKRNVLAEKKYVRDHLADRNVLILDARSPNQYSGEEGEEIRKGHIPGARNLFWETTLEGTEVRVWKNKEDLEKRVAAVGATREKEIIVYCRTGREGSHLFFTLKYILGFPRVRLYRGSWVEWSADKSLPINTGMEP
jgi:thiosulfate/3-mercaptopyruvate sulfurtransferase